MYVNTYVCIHVCVHAHAHIKSPSREKNALAHSPDGKAEVQIGG